MGFTEQLKNAGSRTGVGVRAGATIAAAMLLAASATGLAGCASSGEDLAEPTMTPASPSATETEAQPEAETSTTVVTETSAASGPKPPVCSEEGLRASGFDDDIIMFDCAGGFAYVVKDGTDLTAIVQWDGHQWEAIEHDGRYATGSTGPCYSRELLDQLGVPLEVSGGSCTGARDQPEKPQAVESPGGGHYTDANGFIISAGLGEAGEDASYPACDGRNILILHSVIDRGNTPEAMYEIAQNVLVQDPTGKDRKFTVPGQCPSLRAKVDGQWIYPVYLDFGSDVDAMCRAKANYGGNGRVLSNSAEYVDPC